MGRGEFAELERRLRALENNRGAILRWGEVVQVDEKSGSARVKIDDAGGIVSMPIRVLARRTKKDQHQEMPDIGEPVACLFAGQGFEQGAVIGAHYSDETPSPGHPPHVFYRKFADGTEIEYDRETHKLTGTVKGDVDVTVEKDAVVKCLQKVTIDADDDVTIKTVKILTLEGGVAIILRTPSLIIEGIMGEICEAVMTAAFWIKGQLKHIGEYLHVGDTTHTGDQNTTGKVTDTDGNTNHHSH